MPANAKTPKVLDSFALLAFLPREAGFEKGEGHCCVRLRQLVSPC